jgi:hypothetical protein
MPTFGIDHFLRFDLLLAREQNLESATVLLGETLSLLLAVKAELFVNHPVGEEEGD